MSANMAPAPTTREAPAPTTFEARAPTTRGRARSRAACSGPARHSAKPIASEAPISRLPPGCRSRNRPDSDSGRPRTGLPCRPPKRPRPRRLPRRGRAAAGGSRRRRRSGDRWDHLRVGDASGEPQDTAEHDRPHQVELLLDRQRPGVLERRHRPRRREASSRRRSDASCCSRSAPISRRPSGPESPAPTLPTA